MGLGRPCIERLRSCSDENLNGDLDRSSAITSPEVDKPTYAPIKPPVLTLFFSGAPSVYPTSSLSFSLAPIE